MSVAQAKVVEGGRILLPAGMRRAMNIKQGDTVLLELDGDELRVRTLDGALRRVQEALRPLRIEGRSAADELVAERRAAAESE